jgi:hypothetical protein
MAKPFCLKEMLNRRRPYLMGWRVTSLQFSIFYGADNAAGRPSSGARSSTNAAGWRQQVAHVHAETMALECCVAEWLNQHPAPSAPGRCAWCGNAESRSAGVLPFGTEPGTHTWLHAECWSSWHRARKTDAIAALGAMGVVAATRIRTIGRESE